MHLLSSSSDVLELHPEILTAASAAFGLIPKGLGSTDAGLFLAGDALATAPGAR